MHTDLRKTTMPAAANGDVAMVSAWLSTLNIGAESVKTYARALTDFFKFMAIRGLTLGSVDRAALVDYLHNYLADKSTATRALRCQALKLFFEFLENEHGAKNAARGLKIKVEKAGFKKEFLTQAQAKELLNAANGDSIHAQRDRALMALMLTTGARLGELQNADVCDLENVGDELRLKIKGKGHFEKDAFLKVPPQVAQILFAYLNMRTAHGQCPLFVSHSPRSNGERLSKRAISGIVKSTMRGIGIDSPLFTAHSLRHTAAVAALENGASLAETQIFLRHTSPAITMRYTHGIEMRKNNCAQRVANAFF